MVFLLLFFIYMIWREVDEFYAETAVFIQGLSSVGPKCWIMHISWMLTWLKCNTKCVYWFCWKLQIMTSAERKTMVSTDVRDVTPCNMVEVYWCFKETYCLHLHGERVNQGAYSLTWRWRQQVCLKCQQISARLHGVTLPKVVLFTSWIRFSSL
jgi:hypothetical protein